MAVSTVCSFNVFVVIAFIYAVFLPIAQGQSAAPAPSPTNDGWGWSPAMRALISFGEMKSDDEGGWVLPILGDDGWI
ncbi:hypothetical protein LWI29_026720 [Acer saccharum]|uniref:Uncharacterized protein n=1 Tax=Acer saccharum TaxID=4024 RepID=A0AA39SXH0_ACESA|nr:hypothetical protein LWI29_026720 [Acer saccharum]